MVKGSGISADHKNLLVPNANDTIELLFVESGTDTTTHPYKWYFNLEGPAHGISITGDKIWQITEINGKVLKTPRNFAANGSFQVNINPYYARTHFVQIKIKVLNASTDISAYAQV